MEEALAHKQSRYKNMKPLVEKRRRERINKSLDEVKSLVLQSLKRKESDYSRMEKADILEMAVNYLQGFHGSTRPTNDSSSSFHRYAAGFNFCASNVVCFLNQSHDVSMATKLRLLQGLATRSRRAREFSARKPKEEILSSENPSTLVGIQNVSTTQNVLNDRTSEIGMEQSHCIECPSNDVTDEYKPHSLREACPECIRNSPCWSTVNTEKDSILIKQSYERQMVGHPTVWRPF